MQQKGASRKDVLAELKRLQALDQRYDDGRILGSMCTKPHPLAQKAYRMFFNANLGDPGLFPGSARLEREAIAKLASVLHGKNAAGFIVSGGTEANLMALLAAKNRAKVRNPEVVLGESAHFSFTKICTMLGIKPVYVGLDEAYRVDPVKVEQHITKNTVAIVGTAGTAELGVIDPIDKISEIASRHGVWFHVDAAFGGLVIPFLKGADCPFDFGLAGVASMTVDPHKMGLAMIPAGGILFREAEALEFIKTETPYLTDAVQYTVEGTRPGASAAAAWAVFQALGIEGFRRVVGSCMRITEMFFRGLQANGLTLVAKPTLNILGFRSKNTKALAEALRGRGWYISYVPRYDCIRIVVMPHVKRRHVDAFLKDVREIENL